MKINIQFSVLIFRYSNFIICIKFLFNFLFLILILPPVKEKFTSFKEIVVTAARIEEPKNDVPASFQLISRKVIKNYYPMQRKTFMAGIKEVF